MTFQNEKKTFLSKLDKSKKGEIDERIIPLIKLINSKDEYYTTSSCSGRVYLWKGTGKKNETKWLKLSHDLIAESFLTDLDEKNGLVWLRLEPFILHIACRDLKAANQLLSEAKPIFKKSSILSISNKIIVEIKGSEFMEVPFYQDGKLLFSGQLRWLVELINEKLKQIWLGIEKFANSL